MTLSKHLLAIDEQHLKTAPVVQFSQQRISLKRTHCHWETEIWWTNWGNRKQRKRLLSVLLCFWQVGRRNGNLLHWQQTFLYKSQTSMLWTIKGCLSKDTLLWLTDQIWESSLNARLPSGCWGVTLGRPVLCFMEQHLIGEGTTGSDNLRLFFKELEQVLTWAACILKLAQYREMAPNLAALFQVTKLGI